MPRLIAAVAVATIAASCAEPRKTIAGKVVMLEWESGDYYLQPLDRENPELGVGPLEQVGWKNGVVIAQTKDWGWRFIDVESGDGWHAVLSAQEIQERVRLDPRVQGITMMPPSKAWRTLPAGHF